jgi:hypothetical protein
MPESEEVVIVSTEMYVATAPAITLGAFGTAGQLAPLALTWPTPVQGTTVSAPAYKRLEGIGAVAMATATCTVPANAAKHAVRKDASGGEAFEDPL